MGKSPILKTLRRAYLRSQLLDRRPDAYRLFQEAEDAFSNGTELDRRKFIELLASAGLLLSPLSTLASSSKTFARVRSSFQGFSVNSGQEPVLILGAGLAGLVAAYKLTQEGIPCEIYEASPRIGGRIWTQDRFNSQGQFVELGAELIDTQHTHLLEIARELGVPIEDLTPADAGTTVFHFFVGGKSYLEKDLLPKFQPFAKIISQDMKRIFKDPSRPVCNYRNHLPDAEVFDQISLAEYLDTHRANVDSWVLDVIRTAFWGEYGMDPEEQSCINLLNLIGTDTSHGFKVFGDSDESKRIKGGNSRLIEALEKALSPVVPIHLEHRLLRITDQGTAGLELTFQSGSKTLIRKGAPVLSTIPFKLFRDVEGVFQLGLSPTKQKNIQEMGFGTNSKYMLGFKEKFWRTSGHAHPPTGGYAFTDLGSQTFWETSRMQPGTSAILTNFMGGTPGAADIANRQSRTLNDLEKMYPGIQAQFDGNEALFRWSTYDFAKGSYSCCKPGQWTSLMGSAHEPELNDRLLFAGEHASEEFQGYMNGAVESALIAAKAISKSWIR